MTQLNVRLVQMNSVVGDVAGNLQRMLSAMERARRDHIDVVVFPELALAGYPPEDLLFRADFLETLQQACDEMVRHSQGLMAIFGYAYADGGLFNAAVVAHEGTWVTRVQKQYLPNYGVFDEARYFTPGRETEIIDAGAWKIGVSICEDVWYPDGPYLDQARQGANLLINISASPYSRGKRAARERMLATRADDVASYLLWTNLVGAQDELVFDGQSAVFGPDGQVLARARAFDEDELSLTLHATPSQHRRFIDPRWRLGPVSDQVGVVRIGSLGHLDAPRYDLTCTPVLEDDAELYQALVLGVADYVEKNHFQDVVIGLSGGIDSALTAAIAVDALGSERVHGVLMPSIITSTESREDALAVAKNLGIATWELGIQDIMTAFLDELGPVFAGRALDLTEENLQARIRGTLLMALSNKFGWLVLTTGNKSEMATGYSTLYGDMAGGFAVLKDVLKTQVFRLARWLNQERTRIPKRVISKPPSAELRPNQKDEDSLPPYDILDQILEGYIEEDLSPEALKARDLNPALVDLVVKLVNRNEYKRRQAPVGIKVTPRAFGRDRRMPITRHFE
ncbi:NAD+ synthase [Sulfobacillus sp. hq2]|uniref:NAD+ synthase n=1 Tax=Sulfobacillus TaxID=28033 RepID=UPI000CD0DFB5|nr:NAD+ synthase [Sulfobacillus sp. hq2]POB09461.1 NAD+ synthase [Sulfobacillus sp. hq2]